VLFILLIVVDNGTGNLDAGQQVEVAQDEEHLALVLVLEAHCSLVGKQVVVIVLLVLKLRGIPAGIAVALYLVLIAEIAVAQGKHVVAHLQHCEREVDVC
jgi:hypothetical protein